MVKILGYVVLGILGALVFAAILVPLSILNGWALSWLWFWFLVPLGLPAIGTVHAIGIAGTVGLLTKQYNPTDSNDEQKFEKLAYVIVAPLMALGIGYVVHSFM